MTGQSSQAPPPQEENKVTKMPKQHYKPPVLHKCWYCGQSNEKARAKSPAFGKVCNNCKKENHFASKCAAEKNPCQKKTKHGQRSAKKSSVNQCELEASKEEILLVVSHTQEEVNVVTQEYQTKVLATMNIADKPIKMLIDSGASCNVLPIKFLPLVSNLRKTEHTLKMYSNTTMKALGTSKIKITNPKNSETYMVDFTIVNGDLTPLIGLTAQKMKFLTVQSENILSIKDDMPKEGADPSNLTKERKMRDYSDVFGEELRCMKGKS